MTPGQGETHLRSPRRSLLGRLSLPDRVQLPGRQASQGGRAPSSEQLDGAVSGIGEDQRGQDRLSPVDEDLDGRLIDEDPELDRMTGRDMRSRESPGESGGEPDIPRA